MEVCGGNFISSNPHPSALPPLGRGCPSLISGGKRKYPPSYRHHASRVLDERITQALLGPSWVRRSTSHCRIP